MQEVFSRSKNVIMDEDGEGVVPYLPLDAIDRNAAARTNAANTSGSSSSSTSQSSQGANQ